MASYRVEWRSSAKRELKTIDKAAIPGIIEAVHALGTNPLPTGYRKLRGSDRTYRIRIGEYRIVYEIARDYVVIVRVRHRQDAYR